MLQNLAAEIINCYERARQAREKAERAKDDLKADFLSAEGRWLALAHSYELQHRCRERWPSSTAAGKPAQSGACFGNKVSHSTLVM